MEQNDLFLMGCPCSKSCGKQTPVSKDQARKTRSFGWQCVESDESGTIDVNARPELIAIILAVTIGQNCKIDSRNIVSAEATKSANMIRLVFQDGGHIEIVSDRLVEDIETLDSCGVSVLQV
jgi:hypothetical protein